MEVITLKDGSAEIIRNENDVINIVENFCGNDLAEIIREWKHEETVEELKNYESEIDWMEVQNSFLEDQLGNCEEAIDEIKDAIRELRTLKEEGMVEIPDLINDYLGKILDRIN